MVDTTQQAQRWVLGLVVAGGLVYATSAQALEFGPVSLRSTLNQPLDARIVLSALDASERDSLSVHIASPALFKRFGIERASSVDNIDISTKPSATPGRVIVHVSTRGSVREPFVDFLLEADTSDGQALREYTVLLNPSNVGAGRSSQDTRHAADTTSHAPGETAPQTSGHTPSTPTHGRSLPLPVAADGHYGPVQRGQTLFSIAGQLRGSGVTTDQMAVALYRANRSAFGNGPDTLLAGSTLKVPDQASVAALDADMAQRRIAGHSTGRSAKVSQPSKTGAIAASGEAPPRNLAKHDAGALDNRISAPPANGTGAVSMPADFGQLTLPDGSTLTVSAGATPAQGVAAAAATTDAAARQEPSTDDGREAGSENVSAPDTVQGSDGNDASRPTTATETASPTSSATTQTSDNASARPATKPAAKPLAKPAAQKATPHRVNATPTVDAEDVSEATEGGLLSPRNMLLGLLLLAALGLGAWWRRRREYKSMPLVFDDDEQATTPGASHEPDVDAPEPAAVADEPAEMPPAAAVARANEHIDNGCFEDARACLETALVTAPNEAGVQDKLLELDYLLGDVPRFDADFSRFETQIMASGSRRAAVAAKGRILLPDDPRFSLGDTTADIAASSENLQPEESAPVGTLHEPPVATGIASKDEPQVPESLKHDAEPAVEHACEPSHRNGHSHADWISPPDDTEIDPVGADETGLAEKQRDTADVGAPNDLDWHEEVLPPANERSHDRADETGMTFDLDTSASGNDRPRPIAREDVDAGDTDTTPLMIDAAEFDLDGDQTEQTLDSDTVAIRLDLARMYMEMEDAEMARGLLEEVAANGDDTQRETAQSLIGQL